MADAELAVVRPAVVVCLGATAARAVVGRAVKIGEVRGRILDAPGPQGTAVLVTTHPSALLRIRESADRAAAFDGLVADLRVAAAAATANQTGRSAAAPGP